MTQKERYLFLKAELARREKTMIGIAKLARTTRKTVYMVMSGKQVGRRIRPFIAESIGLDVHDIWPERRAA